MEDDKVVPNNTPFPYTYQFSKMIPETKQAGTIKIVDSQTFEASQKIAAAEVRLEVGGLRYVWFSFGYIHNFLTNF